MDKRINDRNPNYYTLGVPKIYFSAIPYTGNFSRWVDWRALTNAMFGITDTMGKVLNSFGNPVGTVDEILSNCYLGTLDSPSIGGDLDILEHSVSNKGIEEVDRVVVLQRPLEYSFKFEEPDIKNLSRFFVAQTTDLGLGLTLLQDTSVTFQGSNTGHITIINKSLGDPSKAIDVIRSFWLAKGGKDNPPNGYYGFIIGGDNIEPVVGEWDKKRQWIAYAEFDFNTNSHTAWQYVQPLGSRVGGTGYTHSTFKVNDGVLSIVDSANPINTCSNPYTWSADAVLSFNGFEWVGADEGFYGFGILSTRKSFKKAYGCAVMSLVTEVGISMLHIIPRCSLIPDGNLTFDMDNWINASFKMACQRDAGAVLTDRSPHVPIPFGYLQTYEMVDVKG